MKYKGIYWTLFAPVIRSSIAKRYSKELAEQSIRQGKAEYRQLLSRADDLGSANPMAMKTPTLPMSSRRLGWNLESGFLLRRWAK